MSCMPSHSFSCRLTGTKYQLRNPTEMESDAEATPLYTTLGLVYHRPMRIPYSFIHTSVPGSRLQTKAISSHPHRVPKLDFASFSIFVAYFELEESITGGL